MRSGTVHRLLLRLIEPRRETFFAHLRMLPQGELYAEMCEYFMGEKKIEESKTRARFRLSVMQYYQHLTTIGNQLRIAWVGDADSVELWQMYELARLLLQKGDPQGATDLLGMSIKAAGQAELFDLVIRLWGLVRMIKPQPEIKGMTAAEARAGLANLMAYQELMERFSEANQLEGVRERQSAMEMLLANDLLWASDRALSKRATYYYLKLSSYWYWAREYERGTGYQQALIEFIEENQWAFDDAEAEITKEKSLLAVLLRRLRRMDEYQKIREEITTCPLKSDLAERERLFFLYPVLIFEAIESGSNAEVLASISGFLGLRASRVLPVEFITENLYGCLYGALAAGDRELRRRISRMIDDHPKPDFRIPYFHLCKFIGIILALDEDELDEARRLIKNLRATTGLPKGMSEVLSFISFLIVTWEGPSAPPLYTLPESAVEVLESLASNTWLFDYFDLPAWFESKRKKCSMLEIFQHRAVGKSQD